MQKMSSLAHAARQACACLHAALESHAWSCAQHFCFAHASHAGRSSTDAILLQSAGGVVLPSEPLLPLEEPPLLDVNGPVLRVGDALTIEPGLYCRALGGIRVEDMVIVRENGCDNLNHLPEGLTWN